MKLTREQIDLMRRYLLDRHELHPLTPGNIHALCDMALLSLASELETQPGDLAVALSGDKPETNSTALSKKERERMARLEARARILRRRIQNSKRLDLGTEKAELSALEWVMRKIDALSAHEKTSSPNEAAPPGDSTEVKP